MSLIIRYCEGCQERVPPGDFDSGKAIVRGNRNYCVNCKADAPAEELLAEPEQAVAKPAPRKGGTTVVRASGANPRLSSRRITTRATGPPDPGAARGSGGAQRPGRTSGAGHGARHGGLTTPHQVAIGVGVLVVLVIAIAFSMGGGSNPPAPPPVTLPDTPTPEPGNGGDPGAQQPPPADPLAKALAEVEAFERTHPEQLKAIVEQWRTLFERAEESRLAAQAQAGFERAGRRLETAARPVFERLQAEVKRLLAQKQYSEALVAVGRFDPNLRTVSWQGQLEALKAQIEEARKDATVVAQPRLAEGRIPTGGLPVTPFDLRTLDGLARRGGQWTIVDEVLKVESPDDAEAMGLFFHNGRPQRQFRDVYFSFEFRIVKGRFVAAVRWPRTPAAGTSPFRLPLPSGQVRVGSWYRAHIVVQAQQAEFWVERGIARQIAQGIRVEQGSIGFGVPRGSVVELRGLQVRVLDAGDPLGEQPGPTPAGQGIGMFDGKSLTGWGELNGYEGVWKPRDGCLVGENTRDRAVPLAWANAKLTNYRLTLEISELKGEMAILLRWIPGTNTALQLPIKRLPGTGWVQVVIEVRGNRILGTVGNQRINPFEAPVREGTLGFVVVPNASVKLRNIRLLRLP